MARNLLATSRLEGLSKASLIKLLGESDLGSEPNPSPKSRLAWSLGSSGPEDSLIADFESSEFPVAIWIGQFGKD